MGKHILKKIREDHGLTKPELGELLEVNHDYIRRIEKGDLVMGDHLAFKVRVLENELNKEPLHDYKRFLSHHNKSVIISTGGK